MSASIHDSSSLLGVLPYGGREGEFQRKERLRENTPLTRNNLLLDTPEDTLHRVVRFDPCTALTLQFASCRLHRIGRECLQWNAGKIARLCSGSSLLYRLIQGNLFHSPASFETASIYACLHFNLSVPRTIRALGIRREECPGPILSSGELVRFNDRIQGTPDPQLGAIWGRLHLSLVTSQPDLVRVPDADAPIEDVRDWMYTAENQVALQGITRLDLSSLGLDGVPQEIRLCTGLQHLDLSRNLIPSLGVGAFLGLRALRHLNLLGNRLIALEAGSFQSLSALELLYLSRNQLGSLGAGAFHGLIALQTVYLTGNRMTTLDTAAFHGLDALGDIHFFENRLNPVQIQGLMDLAAQKKIVLHMERVRVAQPPPRVPVTLRQIMGYAGNHI